MQIEEGWECNNCGSVEFSGSVSEDDFEDDKMSCGRCGGTEFHWNLPVPKRERRFTAEDISPPMCADDYESNRPVQEAAGDGFEEWWNAVRPFPQDMTDGDLARAAWTACAERMKRK